MANWWDAPVTQSYGVNGEHGNDLGMPVGTPIYSPFAGFVLAPTTTYQQVGEQLAVPAGWQNPFGTFSQTGYNWWGGEVDLLVNDVAGLGERVWYTMHLDKLAVRPGQFVLPGQLIGYSGGETTFQETNVVPGYTPTHLTSVKDSSGPHIEVGTYAVGPNSGGTTIDPYPIITALRNGSLPVLKLANPTGSSPPITSSGPPSGSPLAKAPLADSGPNLNPLDIAGAIGALPATAIGAFKSAFTDVALRTFLIALGGLLLVIGIWIVFMGSPAGQQVRETAETLPLTAI